MSLTPSTVFYGIAHDHAVDNEKRNDYDDDMQVSNDNNKGRMFRLLGKSKFATDSYCDACLQLLNNLMIHHVAERQGTPDWFKARCFSFTSSGVDAQFVFKFKRMKENNVALTEEWKILKKHMCHHNDND